MEKSNNTFIPHIEKTASRARLGSVMFVFAILIFVVAIAVGGISYFMRVNSSAQLVSYKQGLDRSRVRFSEGLPIRSIEEFDKRLRAGRDLLSRHKSFTGLFNLIERITLTNVQFTSFSYVELDGTKKNTVRLIGRAPDYKTIAEQSEQFSLDEEARRYITDVVFSNLSVDPKNENLITFEIVFTVDSEFLLYNRYVDGTVLTDDSSVILPDASPRGNSSVINQ